MDILSRWFHVHQCPMAYAVALAVVACVACDRKPDPGGGDGGTVSAGARLGWTQAASSIQQAQSMTFRLYVDGAAMSLSGVSCARGSTQGRYDCAGRLPSMSSGRHVLELTSILNSVESPRSAPLTISFDPGPQTSLPPGEPEENADETSERPPSSVVCLTQTTRCYDDTVIAIGLADVIGLSPLPDGRLLFIEAGSQVRVIENQKLLPEPALIASAETTLAGLAVDTAFERTRFVFIASAETKGNGERLLNIIRYRELAGTLGEGAQIVTNLPFQSNARAPLAVDGAGLLYVAVPSQALVRSARESALATGAVLRFTRDGAVPPGNWRGSPLLAYGYPQPTSLAVDPVRGGLWLAGIDAGQSGQLSRIAVSPGMIGRVSYLEPVAHPVLAASRFEPSLTILPNVTREQQASIIVGADGQLLQGAITTQGTIDGLAPLATGQSLPLRAAAQSRDGSLYVVVGDTTHMSVLRLTEWR